MVTIQLKNHRNVQLFILKLTNTWKSTRFHRKRPSFYHQTWIFGEKPFSLVMNSVKPLFEIMDPDNSGLEGEHCSLFWGLQHCTGHLMSRVHYFTTERLN